MNSEQENIAFFIKNVKNPSKYCPQITNEDVWYHLSSTMYVFSFKNDYNLFKKCLFERYDGNNVKMFNDISEITDEILQKIEKNKKRLISKTNKLKNYADLESDYMKLPDGEYTSIDLANAAVQSMSKFGLLEEDFIEKTMNKYNGGDYFVKLKGIRCSAYNKSETSITKRHDIYEKILKEAIETDELLSKLGNPIFFSGDKLLFQFNEDMKIRDYVSSNGTVIHVNKETKKTHSIGDLEIVEINGGSEPVFYTDSLTKKLPNELYPQIYKQTRGLPILKEDLAYGFGENIDYFSKKIWEY